MSNKNAIPTSKPAVFRSGQFDVRKKTPIRISQTKKKTSYSELIIKAVKAVGLPRKGASLIAIQKYIRAQNVAPDPSNNRVKFYIRRAILRSLENGILVRPKEYAKSKGLLGRFVLAKKKQTIKIFLENRKQAAKSKGKTQNKKTGKPSKKPIKQN